MNYVNLNDKGFTLVEILVAILLIAIIASAMLPLFTYGYTQIVRTGDRTEALYESQSIIETDSASAPDQEVIRFTFEGKAIDMEINVYDVENTYGSNGNTTTLYYFEGR